MHGSLTIQQAFEECLANSPTQFQEQSVREVLLQQFRQHLRRLLKLTGLAGLQWINFNHHDLELAGARDFPRLTPSDSGRVVGQLPAPKTVEPQCSFLKIGRSYVITASGGVQIESWDVARKNVLTPQVGLVPMQGAPPLGQTGWWN